MIIPYHDDDLRARVVETVHAHWAAPARERTSGGCPPRKRIGWPARPWTPC